MCNRVTRYFFNVAQPVPQNLVNSVFDGWNGNALRYVLSLWEVFAIREPLNDSYPALMNSIEDSMTFPFIHCVSKDVSTSLLHHSVIGRYWGRSNDFHDMVAILGTICHHLSEKPTAEFSGFHLIDELSHSWSIGLGAATFFFKNSWASNLDFNRIENLTKPSKTLSTS